MMDLGFTLICLILCLDRLEFLHAQRQYPRQCKADRVVLTDPNGTITDGPDEYHEFSRCQWLIDGKCKA